MNEASNNYGDTTLVECCPAVCDAGPALGGRWVNPYKAEIDIIRHNLTLVDVRFCRLKSIPAL